MSYLSLPRSYQLYVGLVLFAVIPAVFALVFQNQLYDFYLARFVRPELEQQFGFTAGTTHLPAGPGCCPQAAFVIATVSADGVLGRAGIRSGDLPVGYVHGIASGFYQDLLRLRSGQPIEIRVLAVSEHAKGVQAWRRVRIEPPAHR